MSTLKHAKLLLIDWSEVISDDRLPVYEANSRMMEHHGLRRLPYGEWLPLTGSMDSFRKFFADRGVEFDEKSLYEFY
ncbi:MAG TPA: hypothetical protein VNM40_02940 [Candidatus Paceibacterota bacterium]|nr:hypothetical protein [Candidatus Paceibacterota bacterium]